jgi:hypothetical protein
MRKSVLAIFVVTILVSSLLMFSACLFDADKTPSEEQLKEAGVSLIEALPSFKSLTDNYAYRREIHQTNGEDWFDFEYVKLDSGDVYLQSDYINNNAGWQYRDEVFADYDDLSEVEYTIYKKQSDDNYIEYRKYKYFSTDEEFQRYSYSYDLEANNLRAGEKYIDYSFLNADSFEYYKDLDEQNSEEILWKASSNVLLDTQFKTDLFNAFYIGVDNLAEKRLDLVYIKVENNVVTEFSFNYWGGYNDQQSYHYSVLFNYDNYEFDSASLTSGFTAYIPD